MSSTVQPTTTKKCPHCHARMEAVTPRTGAPFLRCTSCGRDDRAVAAPSAAPNGSGSPCAVEGCPGTVVGGRCACCEKRAAWVDANTPKRECGICGGAVRGYSTRKYCKPCAAAVNRVNVSKPKVANAAKLSKPKAA